MRSKNTTSTRVLNEAQLQAVEFGDGPLMIIAGAGTGKTTVITERIQHLISERKVLPQSILALTFTEKASREMEERVEENLPYGLPEMWISTFHAFCDRILRAEAINIGLDPGYRLMTEAETIMFFRRHLFSFALHQFRPLGNPTKFISGMIQHFSRLKDEDVLPGVYLKWVNDLPRSTPEEEQEYEKYLELANAYSLYEDFKQKEGVADYADLISNVLQLFRTRPAILEKYQTQFRYILIDEFQDTNFAQNELAILLAGESQNITVVGDDDQAIYRWRGAAVSNMVQFRTRFPKVKIVVLKQNYRSSKEILDRSYELIQFNNPDRLEVVEKVDKKLESMRMIQGEEIEFIYTDRVENEADEVAKTITRLITEHQYSYSDFGILVRANNHAEPFTRALVRHGIPYQFLGPGQLFRQPEVKDLIGYLKVLYNFEDNVAMYRVLTMEWLNLPPRDIAALMNFAKRNGVSLFETCEKVVLHKDTPQLEENTVQNSKPELNIAELSPETPIRLKMFVEMVKRHLHSIKKETAGQILYYFLQDSGLLQQFTAYKTVAEERTALNIAKFFDKLKTYEAEHEEADIFTVVDWIDLSLTLGESPAASDTDWTENNAVTLMTIHAAKGLEFPVVFMINLVSARFPTTERKEQIPIPDQLIKEIVPTGDFHLQEERRLFYVGMTRARDYLFFTGAKYYGEGKREKKISPFIVEALGSSAVKKLEQRVIKPMSQLSLLDWQTHPEPVVQNTSHAPVTYLSYSQLHTFTTCPLQYKYRYILKIPVPPSAALTFGDTIHKVINVFYERIKQGEKAHPEMLLELLDTLWSSIGFGDKAYEKKMKLHGKDLLTSFYTHAFDPARIPLSLEHPFRIKISPELKLGGKIDRVDRLTDGTLEIIDYKTGHAPKARDVKNDLQLTVYAMAATDEGLYRQPVDKVIVSFYFFEGDEKISATRTQEQIDEARIKIRTKAEEISTSIFTPTPGKHCDFCEFRLICEAWQ